MTTENIPNFEKDFVSETVLQSYPWREGMEKERRMRGNAVYETITDLHILKFLNDWELKSNIGIWNATFDLTDHKHLWEDEVQHWIPRLGVPGLHMEWFWKACVRVWKSAHRDTNCVGELEKQVEWLRTLPQPEQRTPEWYEMRESMITASDWATCLGMDPYKKINEFLEKKSGGGVPFTGNATTEWGVKYEPVADIVYENRTHVPIIEFGLVPHPRYSFIGASPDGITKQGRMVEIKCPPSRAIKGIIPRYYWAQVQGQLEICDLERCDFLECKIKEFEEEQADDWDEVKYESKPYSMNPAVSSNTVGWEFGTLPKAPNGFMEKGATMSFRVPGQDKLAYTYSKVNPTVEEAFAWKEEQLAEHPDWTLEQFSFWVLTQVSCIPIFRDKEWFDTVALPKLATAWNGVRYWRAKSSHMEETGPYHCPPGYTVQRTLTDQEETDGEPVKPKKATKRKYNGKTGGSSGASCAVQALPFSIDDL